MNKHFVVIAYKHYSNVPGVSHIGLGVTAMNCAKYLLCQGVRALVLPVVKEGDIDQFLRCHPDVTHLNVSALWVKTQTFSRWAFEFPHVKFSVTCHSNAAFLQHEPAAITLIREAISLEETSVNFRLCGNSSRFCSYIQHAYGGVATELPNLYFLNSVHNLPKHTPWRGGKLKIGIFGAMRALKNFNTATAAAIQLARELKVDTEIWVNGGRKDSSDANVVMNAIKNATHHVPSVKLIEYNWAPWPEFRKTVGSMNILMQPSHSETFNNVTADGIAEGVPSVVSSAIDWAPKEWQADVDSVMDCARVGMHILLDPHAAFHGYQALKKHNEQAFHLWLKYLEAK